MVPSPLKLGDPVRSRAERPSNFFVYTLMKNNWKTTVEITKHTERNTA